MACPAPWFVVHRGRAGEEKPTAKLTESQNQNIQKEEGLRIPRTSSPVSPGLALLGGREEEWEVWSK